MFDQLKAPFPPAAVSWRAQQVTRNGDKALALAYIDARDVMHRLDEVCGPENWQDSYGETPKGRLICTIQIRTAEGWVSKSDGAGDTDVEGEKGAISDAFKRCAVKWGIGRYLYDTDTIYAPCEVTEKNGKTYWKAWKPDASRMFAAALDKATKTTHSTPPQNIAPDIGPVISDDQITLIIDMLKSNGIPVAALLKAAGVESLPAMRADFFDRAMTWINNKIAAKQEKEAA